MSPPARLSDAFGCRPGLVLVQREIDAVKRVGAIAMREAGLPAGSPGRTHDQPGGMGQNDRGLPSGGEGK
ncbi:hypothetical protein CHELA1G11_13271 [Hyphomicrobiales bacterium]|nr:hypothetical protein CHELA1G2_11042 [Hyphomicrobiales bacterium]CAH1670501.1 hypothetical protein CHELA1G11_13271 [Hyphomicrobiales bacterium]